VGLVVAGLRRDRIRLLVPVLQQLVPCRVPAAILVLSIPVGKPGVMLVQKLTFLESPPEKTLHLKL